MTLHMHDFMRPLHNKYIAQFGSQSLVWEYIFPCLSQLEEWLTRLFIYLHSNRFKNIHNQINRRLENPQCSILNFIPLKITFSQSKSDSRQKTKHVNTTAWILHTFICNNFVPDVKTCLVAMVLEHLMLMKSKVLQVCMFWININSHVSFGVKRCTACVFQQIVICVVGYIMFVFISSC